MDLTMKHSTQLMQQFASIALSVTLAAGAAVALVSAVWGEAPHAMVMVDPLDPHELESEVLALDCQLASNKPSALCSTPITVADQSAYR
jgi:hypothetical protein